MPEERRSEPIATWQDGDSVAGFALLTRKERRRDKNGREFLDLELVDASGSIAGKVWSDSPALSGEYEAQTFVAFKGTVKSFRDQLQLSVLECREATESDRRHGFDESKLVPTTPYDIGELWSRLRKLFEERLDRPVLRRLAAETLAEHGAALREHPAAKSIHHAYRGGLLEHVVSMAELAVHVADHYQELDRDLLLLGVLFHDLGKLHEIGAMPANDYTKEGRLVGHVVIGRDLLRRRCESIPDFPPDLLLQLEHLVLSHQGRREFGSPIEPMTAEAIALHFIDNLDAKLAQVRGAALAGNGFRYLRSFGGFVFVGDEEKGESTAADEDAGPAEPAQSRLLL